jgi:hypothetical protein
VNKHQTTDFIQALNALQPYVPPLLFAGVTNSEVTRALVAIANGQAICDVRPSDRSSGDANSQAE